MTTHDEPSTRPGARRVVLARRRCDDTAEQTDHTVHLIALPFGGEVSGLCGARIPPADIETVTPGDGVWCTMCFVCHVTGRPAAPDATSADTGSGRAWATLAYRELGWPVTLRGDQVSLNLDLDVDAVALVIPAILATEVADILVRRRCPPPMLAHPALPTHRIIVAGERFPVPLGWPPAVHRVTGTLLLPPTVTAHGPVQWVRPPQPHALKLSREIDVLAALRTALSDPPPTSSPAHF